MHDRSQQERAPIDTSLGDSELIDAIGDLLSSALGRDPMVFHEPTDDPVHLDLYWVPFEKERPFHIIVTSGMASKPQEIPEDREGAWYTELCTMLPFYWPLPRQGDARDGSDTEGAWWPFNMMKVVAKYPHAVGTALSVGHTVVVTDGTFAMARGVRFTGFLLLPGVLVDPSLDKIRVGERDVHFLSVFPLYPEEMDFKVANGLEAFLAELKKTDLPIPDMWRPDRVNACGGARGTPMGGARVRSGAPPAAPTKRRRWWWPF